MLIWWVIVSIMHNSKAVELENIKIFTIDLIFQLYNNSVIKNKKSSYITIASRISYSRFKFKAG